MFRKKMIGLTLAALMIGCMGASVSAHETDDVATVSEIMPRGAICSNCGLGETMKHTTKTRDLINNYPCSHYDHGRDLNYKVTTITWWTCTDCEWKSENVETITYETDCQGYN